MEESGGECCPVYIEPFCLERFTIIAEESAFMEQSGGEWTRVLSCLYRAVLLREVYNYSRGECIDGAEWRRVNKSVVLFI